jgi:hypothetical protein
MSKFYVDGTGAYIGAFDGTTRDVPGVGTVEFFPQIPPGAIEVPVPPDDGLRRWDGAAWVATPASLKARAVAVLAQTDGAIPAVVDAIWAALKAKGVVADADVPPDVRDMLAARAAERGKL